MKTLIATLALVFTGSFANAQYNNVSSGLLLGVYCQPCSNGMKVTSTIPGYTAEGRLFPGDILKRATIDGYNIYNLRSHYEMERSKTAIGANREAAMEIYRPGQGLIYVWVQFTPLYGPAATSATGHKQYGAQFKTEREKPGARAMFQKSGSAGGSGGVRSGTPRNSSGSTSSNGAARLFGR